MQVQALQAYDHTSCNAQVCVVFYYSWKSWISEGEGRGMEGNQKKGCTTGWLRVHTVPLHHLSDNAGASLRAYDHTNCNAQVFNETMCWPWASRDCNKQITPVAVGTCAHSNPVVHPFS